MTIEPPLYAEITGFWRQAGPARWFAKDDAFDEALRVQFQALHFAAARGELSDWAETAEGSLALLILLDQLPRNIFRGSAHAFATDPLARAVAEAALARDHHLDVEPPLRPFFYLPYEHSEAVSDQDCAVVLFEAHARETGDQDSLKWAVLHRELIERFGRFPHRNACLGRESTEDELAYLAGGGFKG
jgi:uncharacterized protein (DUF924 family)